MDRFIETDGCPSSDGRPRSDYSKKVDLCDERIDSGFSSGNLASLPLDDDEHDSGNIGDISDCLNSGSSDLSNRISKLQIDPSSSTSSSRLDSGISEGDIQSHSQTHSSQWISNSLPSSSSSVYSAEHVAEIFRGDEDGDSHLHLSIIHGSEHIINQIIALAPDWDWLNQANNLLQTPLHLAVITRQAAIVRRLMCAGASVDVRDEHGNTPLHNACRLGFEDIARMLLTPVLYEERYQNKYEIPYQRVPQDLDIRNYEGLSCLHLAAIGGHINVMRLLLGAGACVNTPEGKNGRTVLHMAADWGHIEMLKFLLQRRDVNIDADTYAGLTPIILAFGRNHFDAVEVLYKNGASYDIDSLNDDSDMESSDDEMSESGSSCRIPPHQAYMQTCR